MIASDTETTVTTELHHHSFLTPKEASQMLNLSVHALAKSRLDGSGPVFCKFGKRVRYQVEDITRWVNARRHSSTSVALAGSKPTEQGS